jgi:hypothetical protein
MDEPRPRGNPKWQKGGPSFNPGGRPKAIRPIKDLARENSLEAMQKIVKLMNDEDPRVALAAAIHVLDRAWGKPEQKADVEMVHRFAQVPSVMSKADWLATRGDPRLLELKPAEPEKPKDPNSKLN